ncbi:Lrp/AsnC family transcriptional regulator [Candidatus Endoriftia persephone]|jgi:DNA-binding Lrp family transcriptional regulator|uniref:siroheme decarboxylase n=3 Tax=Gammaproteobacteria TaxID=1236 RepID=G2FJG1_9GAMM|nr:AsnC family transcriptional regulator [Candidatus Endoriftia persephone]EGV50671.1 heme d1 biosynthesis protein NirH [endosymbiont of Riftia pachyptila (vent Ph05)]EGW53063.1 heme d1 biosynthesis protein NirH [endosymbiont of Tevnia jerichonana (vent Tica)]USF87773.1 AsnC family transcriptional regulator [Candidatus Endoriftia persephone]
MTTEPEQVSGLDELDRKIVLATQAGLPLAPQPYEQIAEQLGTTADEVMRRMQQMLESGVIRRIGAVPNHYTLGFRGNGMTVWDVPDEKVGEYGRLIGALDFVSHAYHRPRHLPEWRYNLFAMAHGRDRDEVLQKAAIIAELLGADNRAHEVLFSSRILKKTGMRIGV